jgi:hypothetical protein
VRAIISALVLAACAANPSVERAFVIAESSLIPEGIAHDQVTGDFYLSSTWQRRIVRITPEGEAQAFTPRGSSEFYGVLGLRVDPERRRSWAAHASAGASMPIEGDHSEGQSGLALFDLDVTSGN